MGNLMEKNKVKQFLKINSFNEIDKKSASKFVNMLSKVDKNVTIQDLEQSDKIASEMKDTLKEYYKRFNNIVKSADDNMKSINKNSKRVIQVLIKKLDNKDISFDDSKYIINKILEIQKLQSEENEKHRNFLLKVLGFIASFFLGLFGIKNRYNKLQMVPIWN